MTVLQADLVEFRRLRDEREAADFEARNTAIRERLMPLLIRDIQGKLTSDFGLTLIELLEDLGLDDNDYQAIRTEAKNAVLNFHQIQQWQQQQTPEAVLFARRALAKRRAERKIEIAEKELRDATRLNIQIAQYQAAIVDIATNHPYFFNDGDLSDNLVKSVASPKPEPVAESRICPICQCASTTLSDDGFCGPQCHHVSHIHRKVLEEMKVL